MPASGRSPSRAPYYPLYADLQGRACVVVGGGVIAERKAAGLLDAGAVVTVVSPQATTALRRWARAGRLVHRARRFKRSDVAGSWLVFAATNESDVNERVFAVATRARIFANVADQPPLCSFIAPAIVRKGPITVAISTGGASPALAKKLKRDLAAHIGPAYARMLRLARALRPTAKTRLPRYHDRRIYFDDLMEGEAFDLVRRNKTAQARRLAMALLRDHVERSAKR